MNFITELCNQFNLQSWQIENIINLIEEGNTIPFISRYRKEAHGSLDDQTIREINERYDYLKNLDAKKDEVRKLITSLDKMTDEINTALENAQTITEVDDIYRPFRPKRKTRASVAKEKGLEPLACQIFDQKDKSLIPEILAKDYINPDNDINSIEDALSGASDIIAEKISDNANLRKRLRAVFQNRGLLVSKAVDKDKSSVYDMYYDFSEAVPKLAGHRILAINRGEKEKFLKVSIELDQNFALSVIYSEIIEGISACAEFIKIAALDAYKRLIYPSIEREIRNMLTESASENAIKVFSTNLRNLLMQPPVKGKVTMGLDPGYRTGCKVAVVDKTGKVLDTGVIYPTHSQLKIAQSKKFLTDFITKYSVQVVAIGNGTASKETEIFFVDVMSSLPEKNKKEISYMVVNEAGASVYSASKLAASEFPDFDVTLRSAVSIARRLQDPLAELVKIEPKAIGVGQYQHDMPKKNLESALDGVVEDCVNSVGVDLNTASPSLLAKVSGISNLISKNIVKYREENGEFQSRDELKNVSKLGPKIFEQCAGFLRVFESDNPLDNTAVHPESYKIAADLLSLFSYDSLDISNGKIKNIAHDVEMMGVDNVCKKLCVGKPTLIDIVKELEKPGRDPRDELPKPLLRKDIMDIKSLKPGMELIGTVRNVIDFGAFIDIGVHQDGLVHISQICDKFIKNPGEVLKIGDIVKVWVIDVDQNKGRISLTMKDSSVKNLIQ